MNKIKESVIEEIVDIELFHTYTIQNGKKINCYETEGFDKDKIEAEGSTWIVYVMDCMNEYYHRHKDRIDSEARDIILQSA